MTINGAKYQAKVIDSTDKSDVHRVYTFLLASLSPGRSSAPVQKGRTYLTVSTEPIDGIFYINSGGMSQGRFTCESPGRVNLSVLLNTETSVDKLPTIERRADLISEAILDSLPPMTDQKVWEAVRLLGTLHPDQLTRTSASVLPDKPAVSIKPDDSLVSYTPEGPQTRKIRELISNAKTKYQVSKLNELLVRWRVPDSVAPYIRSLVPFLSDMSRYSSEADLQPGWGLIQNINTQYGDLDGIFNFELAEYLSQLDSAKNPNVILMWLGNFGSLMDLPQLKRLARLLNHGDPRVRYEVASILANQLHEPSYYPKRYGTVDGQNVHYPDLDQYVEYWKDRLGVK